MPPFLARLFGMPSSDTGSIVSSRFELHPVWAWGWIAILGVIAIAVAVASYRRRDVELDITRRIVLGSLRALALLAILGIFLRPTLALTVEGLVRQTLILLFDESASLALRDPRTEPTDRTRAAIAEGRLPAESGLDQNAPDPGTWSLMPTRLDLLRSLVTNRELALLDRLSANFDLRTAAFSGDLGALILATSGLSNSTPSDSAGTIQATRLAAALKAEGSRTAPGTALAELLDRERGRPVGGLVVFTDGIRNAGTDPREALAAAKHSGIPVHFVGLGTTAPRDVQLVDLRAAEVSFVRDEIPVTARIRARGLTGETVRVALLVDGERVDEKEVRIENDADITVPLRYTPPETGDFELAVDIPVRKDEILAENNHRSRRLRVIDDRIRVLLVEQSPRWEFRYLQALLLRDRRVDLKCVLFDGEAAITRSPGSPYLDQIPARREDLFAYDLVIFGDVDPKNFTPAQLEVLAEFVARSSGSFLMIAGRRFSPWGYRDTALEKLLPVEFDSRAPVLAASTNHDRPLQLSLTPEGSESGLLQLAEDPAENSRRWQALAPVFWTAAVTRAKPAAQVLVVDETPRADRPATTPVIALQQYGVGQSMFVGTDNTWRWRRNEGEAFFVSFWGRVVQRLAIHHLLTGSRRTQLLLDRTSALRGEKIAVTARMFTSSFEPLPEPVVKARIERDSGGSPEAASRPDAPSATASELLLRAVPDQPGVFRAEWIAPSPGRYRISLGDDAPATADLSIEERLVETGETAMQETALREWAALGGGEFFREDDVSRLPELARSMARTVQSRLSAELWMSPAYYLGVLLFLSAEWALRKWWRLK